MHVRIVGTVGILVAVGGCRSTAGGIEPQAGSTSGELVATSSEASSSTSAGSSSDATSTTGADAAGLPEVWGVPVLEDENDDPDVVEVRLTAKPTDVPLGGGASLPMYTYNGAFVGPLLQAKVGDEVIVHFDNGLDEPTTVHWHGLRIPEDMDGNPRIQDPVQPGGSFEYRFVVPDAGSYWYHPHVRANEQVEKGLYAPIAIHDPADPEYDLERFLVLDDILLQNGQFAPFLQGHPEQMHGRHGNVLLVNGDGTGLGFAVEQGAVERWRLVNVANARTMELSLRGASFRVIASDGGLLAEPYKVDRLQIAVGQRFDLEVTYDEPGTVTFISYVLAADGQGGAEEVEVELVRAEVTPSQRAPIEVEWPDVPELFDLETDREVELVFDAVSGPDGLQWTINGMSMPHEPLFSSHVGERVRMILRNAAGPEHPFHLHGQFFRIAGARGAEEPGLKDSVLVPGLATVEIVADFSNPGRWMAHCHILEHAELGMMAEILVDP